MSAKDGDAGGMGEKTPSDPQIAAVTTRGSVRAPLKWILAALGVAGGGGGVVAAMQAHVGDRVTHVQPGERETAARSSAEVTAALSGLRALVERMERNVEATAIDVRAIKIDLAIEQDRRRRLEARRQ